MSYFEKLAELGCVVVCRRNLLGTTAMFAVLPEELEQAVSLELLPEWRVVDFRDDRADIGVRMLYEKLTLTGHYAQWDERMAGIGMADVAIGFEHRPQSERFQPVED